MEYSTCSHKSVPSGSSKNRGVLMQLKKWANGSMRLDQCDTKIGRTTLQLRLCACLASKLRWSSIKRSANPPHLLILQHTLARSSRSFLPTTHSHTMRFTIIALAASLVATATAAPLTKRIIGGGPVPQGDIPYIVEIQGKGGLCTGFLVGPQTVMTGKCHHPLSVGELVRISRCVCSLFSFSFSFFLPFPSLTIQLLVA